MGTFSVMILLVCTCNGTSKFVSWTEVMEERGQSRICVLHLEQRKGNLNKRLGAQGGGSRLLEVR